MHAFLHDFYHNETRDRSEKGLVNIPKDQSLWPLEWKTIAYKKYIFFKPIPLLKAGNSLFRELLSKRRSSVGHILTNKPTLEKVSHILRCGYGLQEDGASGREENRTVPSGGRLYPLEIYLLIFKDIPGCKAGMYHYGVRDHSLEPISFDVLSKNEILSFSPQQKWLEETNGMICIASVFSRSVYKYGSRGYRYILLEAGHAAQNMLVAGTENNINIIPIGGVEELNIEKRLGLNSSLENIVYTLYF